MKHLWIVCLLSAGMFSLPTAAHGGQAGAAVKCPTSFHPGSFTSGDFFSNFDNSCYLIAFWSGNGSGDARGDLNSMYSRIYFCASLRCNPSLNIPPFQLIVIGEFTNARYSSVEIYDEHNLIAQNIPDANIAPLTSAEVNPFGAGVAYQPGQRYALPINFGGTPGKLEPGCLTTGYNLDQNALDGTQRHPFVNWNLYPGFFASYPAGSVPPHIVDTPNHSNPNGAGYIIVRNYLSLTPVSGNYVPHVIVRDVATGCAYPASMVRSMGIVTTDYNTGMSWMDQVQMQNHNVYAHWQPSHCWINLPPSQSEIQWRRSDEYIPAMNPDTGYLVAYPPSGLPKTLANANEYLRLRFRVPTTPPTPCTNGCARDGSEQMRYSSVSFETSQGATLASLPDGCPAVPLNPCTPLVQDANGYVTLIAGTGLPRPAQATPENGFTWIDLAASQTGNYLYMNEITMRGILPAASFNCVANMIPYRDGEATSFDGGTQEIAGLMGRYAPQIDYPTLAQIGPVAAEAAGPEMCATPSAFPSGAPQLWSHCGVAIENPAPQIGVITSWCTSTPGAGCSSVYAQAQPQISILAHDGTGGFGTFPLGLPYTGTTAFLQITDTTQAWSAGYSGDSCTVTIGEWDDNLVSVIANAANAGGCSMNAGDQLVITIWNPQNPSIKASQTVTVEAPPANILQRRPPRDPAN